MTAQEIAPDLVLSTDQRISMAVRTLTSLHGMKNAQLKDVMHVGQNAVFMKLRGDAPWKAAEVERLADYFGVSVGDLYDGLANLGNRKAPHRSGGGRGLPQLDLNQQPFD